MEREDPYTTGQRDAIHKATRTLEELATIFETEGLTLDAACLRGIARGIRDGAEKPPARAT